ncbi:hypothetical protein GOP47_0006764, partial [Adiantum capillus-veneris]
ISVYKLHALLLHSLSPNFDFLSCLLELFYKLCHGHLCICVRVNTQSRVVVWVPTCLLCPLRTWIESPDSRTHRALHFSITLILLHPLNAEYPSPQTKPAVTKAFAHFEYVAETASPPSNVHNLLAPSRPLI